MVDDNRNATEKSYRYSNDNLGNNDFDENIKEVSEGLPNEKIQHNHINIGNENNAALITSSVNNNYQDNVSHISSTNYNNIEPDANIDINPLYIIIGNSCHLLPF